MKKFLKIVGAGIASLFALFILMHIFSDPIEIELPPPVIDSSEFSRISSAELVEKMGEPESIEDYKWTIPMTGQKIVGKSYVYEKNRFEFILFNDQVARLTVYSDTFWGNGETKMKFTNENDLFHMFGVEKGPNIKKEGESNYAIRYSRVSNKVADFWIQGIDGKEFDSAKITYNANYF